MGVVPAAMPLWPIFEKGNPRCCRARLHCYSLEIKKSVIYHFPDYHLVGLPRVERGSNLAVLQAWLVDIGVVSDIDPPWIITLGSSFVGFFGGAMLQSSSAI